jgi:hypothetical protein
MEDKKVSPEDEAAHIMNTYSQPFLNSLTKLSKRSLIRLLHFVCVYPFESGKLNIRDKDENQLAMLADSLRNSKEVMFYAFNKRLEQDNKLNLEKGEENETNK